MCILLLDFTALQHDSQVVLRHLLVLYYSHEKCGVNLVETLDHCALALRVDAAYEVHRRQVVKNSTVSVRRYDQLRALVEHGRAQNLLAMVAQRLLLYEFELNASILQLMHMLALDAITHIL